MVSLTELDYCLQQLGLLRDGEWQRAAARAADDSIESILDHLLQMPHPEIPNHTLLTAYQKDRILACFRHQRLHMLDFELRRNDFIILEALRGGNTSRVFKGWCTNRRMLVAIKEQHHSTEHVSRIRLRREAAILRLLNDSRIVNYVAFEDSIQTGGAFLAMQFAVGQTLRDHLQENVRFSESVVIRIITHLLHVIGHAHAAGVIHRDIKPGNIVLEKNKSGLRVKLLDFGLGKVTRENHKVPDLPDDINENLTQTGSSLGTPRYMSPEQFVNTATAGPESDIYSIGTMAYEMVTGEPPFSGSFTALFLVKRDQPAPLASTKIRISQALDDAIARMLDPDPARRGTIPEILRLLGQSAPSVYETAAPRTSPETSDPVQIETKSTSQIDTGEFTRKVSETLMVPMNVWWASLFPVSRLSAESRLIDPVPTAGDVFRTAQRWFKSSLILLALLMVLLSLWKLGQNLLYNIMNLN